jgi:hypothetical protein
MKFKLLSLGLFSLSTLFTLAPSVTKPAFALCTATDVSVQVALSDEPATQENDVSVESDPDCYGNNSTHVMTQFGDAEKVTQTRKSEHHLGGGNNPLSELGVETPTIFTPVHVKVNVPRPGASFPR